MYKIEKRQVKFSTKEEESKLFNDEWYLNYLIEHWFMNWELPNDIYIPEITKNKEYSIEDIKFYFNNSSFDLYNNISILNKLKYNRGLIYAILKTIQFHIKDKDDVVYDLMNDILRYFHKELDDELMELVNEIDWFEDIEYLNYIYDLTHKETKIYK